MIATAWNIAEWRPPTPASPAEPVDAPLQPFIGAAAENRQVKEFGGVLRKN